MASPAQIPYEILHNIFELLDKNTLLDAALASRRLNEIASWSLYRRVVINPDKYTPEYNSASSRSPFSRIHDGKDASLSLKRRPHLNNAVQEITLYAPASTISLSKFLSFIEEVKLFTSARSMEICGGFIPRELALLLPAILALPHLITLILFEAPEVLKYLDYNSARRLTIHTSLYALKLVEPSPFVSMTTVLSCGWGWINGDLTFLRKNHSSFTSLHTILLTHEHPMDPSSICELVLPLKRLQRLEFDYRALCCPAELTELKDLRIHFKSVQPRTFSERLELLVHCIAGKSRLERLDIKSKAKSINSVGIRGLGFFKLILNGHVETLQKLKVPSLHPSKSLLQKLLTEGTRLSTLWIGGNQQTMTQMYDTLPFSASLATLRIHFWECHRFLQKRPLLDQNGSNLQVFKVCMLSPWGQMTKTTWKVSWAYNEQERHTIRQVVCKPSDDSTRVEVENWVKGRILTREDEYRRGNSGSCWYSGSRRGDMARWIASYGSSSSSNSDMQKIGNQPILPTGPNQEPKHEWPAADDMSLFLNDWW
ncbi:hypothetical protein CPB86DRAFT_816564 [Serendipita vermifera]|nr:hypothetical protein CPB86DRAFT_816564 [Serendipita vermifera]